MSEEVKVKKTKSKDKSDKKTEKKSKSKDEKKSSKIAKKAKEQASASASALSLLASNKTLNADLSSLFAVKQPAVKADVDAGRQRPAVKPAAEELDNEADLESLSEDYEDISDESADEDESAPSAKRILPSEDLAQDEDNEESQPKRKRKRKGEDDLEDKYMSRIAREEAKDAEKAAIERASKRQKANGIDAAQKDEEEDEDEAEADEEAGSEEDDDVIMDDAIEPPPKHETQVAADEELAKASRTVFLGNVSTAAITSKSSRKTLMAHLESFFPKLPAVKENAPKHKVESIRFRSTAYSSAIPKKAAFAKQELMDATTKSTNAYAVYSTQILAREAAKRLNGTTVLDRHLRVDEVAHPAKVDNRRCVFVGNLGFVDDETNIQDANEEEGREVRKRGKEPADVEEGLWRTFGKCGKVESVRVIRDSTTRVGKGIAYVQFEDENGVEAALLLNEKKFPPMLPRKLRVSRAKAQKRNPKPGSDRPTSKPRTGGYQRKVTSEEASKMGRAGKLLGRAAASKMRKPERSSGPAAAPRPARPTLGDGIKRPENFVFEGYRASSKGGKSGLKLGKKGSGKTSSAKKVRVTKRSAGFRADKKKKSA